MIRVLRYVAQFLYSLYGLISFALMLLILLPLVIISSFFGKIKGGNIIYKICRGWSDIQFIFWGMWHRNIYESPHDRSRPFVFVFNHISYIDIPIIMKSIRGQSIRVLGKAEAAKIPLFGIIYRKAAIMVDRGNALARARSVQEMLYYLKQNISVVIAPEGTFNMTGKPLKEFYDGAFRIAIETQTPIKPLLFLDAFDRLSPDDFFSLTPGKSRTVFLKEIEVKGLTMADMPILKKKVFDTMEEALIRYNASWIDKKGNEQ